MYARLRIRTGGLFSWSTQMNQRELDREVAAKTGESICTIRGLGFSTLRSVIPIEERAKPLVVDWDQEQRFRKFERQI